VRHELVKFLKGVVVEQELNPLPRSQFASRALPGLSFRAASCLGLSVEVAESLQ